MRRGLATLAVILTLLAVGYASQPRAVAQDDGQGTEEVVDNSTEVPEDAPSDDSVAPIDDTSPIEAPADIQPSPTAIPTPEATAVPTFTATPVPTNTPIALPTPTAAAEGPPASCTSSSLTLS